MYNDKIIITYNFTDSTPIQTRDTMLKGVKEVEFEIKRQLDTAIKNDIVSYKNSSFRHTICEFGLSSLVRFFFVNSDFCYFVILIFL